MARDRHNILKKSPLLVAVVAFIIVLLGLRVGVCCHSQTSSSYFVLTSTIACFLPPTVILSELVLLLLGSLRVLCSMEHTTYSSLRYVIHSN